MADSQTRAQAQAQTRFINPWALHLQKLGLELKCPFCLELYSKPTLLPCNHIFCRSCVKKSYGSDCPLCKDPYVEQDLREAPYIENVVNIYRCLDSSFAMHLHSTDAGKGSVQCPVPAMSNVPDHLAKEPMDTHSPGNSTSDTTSKSQRGNQLAVLPNSSSVRTNLERCSNLANPGLRSASVQRNIQQNMSSSSEKGAPKLEEHGAVYVDMNQEEVSLDSPPSSGASKVVEHDDSCDRGSADDTTEKYLCKKSFKRVANGSGTKGNSYNKKQKQLDQSLSEIPQDLSPLAVRNLQNSASTGSEIGKFGNASDTQPAVGSDSASLLNFVCAFCQTWKITEGSGLMQHFAKGKQVSGPEACCSNVMHVHQKCIEWAPQVYYKDDNVLKNLDKELARAGKLKCAGCGLKGAALGCFVKSCQRSYHVPCAYEIPDCRWDTDDFLMLCPAHNSVKFPREKVKKSAVKKSEPHKINVELKNLIKSDFWAASPTGSKNWILCGSALSIDEKFLLVKFAKLSGATVTKAWNPDVTHVIAATDAKGACSRTLKVLMAILEGKWILNIEWIKACMELKRPVDEEPYEISVDNHGCCNGPKTGRLKALSNAPMLFIGLKFFFNGNFMATYKRDLQDLVVAAGGTILESKEKLEQSNDEHFNSSPSTTLVIYNEDGVLGTGEVSNVQMRQVEAEMVASVTGSQVIPHTWILDSIASCKLQPFVQKSERIPEAIF